MTSLLASWGCSEDSSPDSGHTLTDAQSSEAGEGKFDEPYELSIEVPDVGPGVEGTKCLVVRLGNPTDLKVGLVHNTLSNSSHHLVVSTVEDPNETEQPLFDCPPFRAVLIGAPLTVTQKHDDVIPMPDGVGFPLVADQLMHLEMHYINTETEPVDVRAEIELHPLKAGEAVEEASFLIVGSLDIQIPPRSTHRLDSTFVSLPDTYDGVNFYAATGHTHRFGTAVRLATADSPTDPGTTIYEPETFEWAEPDLEVYSPPIQIPSGGGFNFDCEWNNPTDEELVFGESALEEMCFFWTYYYPRREGDRTLIARAAD